MTLPRIIWILPLFSLLIFFIACDSANPTKSQVSTPVEIADQNLQGKIEGVSWSFASGKAEPSFWEPEKLSFNLYCTEVDSSTICSSSPMNTDLIMFTVPNDTGSYQLSFNNEKSQTVTLYSSASGMNSVATSGILKIYTMTDDEITIGMNITFDKTNYANGKCTVTKCD